MNNQLLTHELIEQFNKACKDLVEAFKEAIKPIIDWFMKNMWPQIKNIVKNYIKYKKYIEIYNRAKSKRIRKKQLCMIGKKVLI